MSGKTNPEVQQVAHFGCFSFTQMILCGRKEGRNGKERRKEKRKEGKNEGRKKGILKKQRRKMGL